MGGGHNAKGGGGTCQSGLRIEEGTCPAVAKGGIAHFSLIREGKLII